MLKSYIAYTCLGVFFFNDPATTEIYTLSLHDALPICPQCGPRRTGHVASIEFRRRALLQRLEGARSPHQALGGEPDVANADRKSTRLNSSHSQISYAVFCLKINTYRPLAVR